MAAKRHKPEEIVSKLRQVDVLLGQGKSRIDAIRQIGVTAFTYYRWRKNYGGMGTDQLKLRTAGIPKNTCLTAGAMVDPVGPQEPPTLLRSA